MGGYAWVTLATNDSYSLGALVLAHSLQRVGSKHDLAVLITPGVTGPMREKLASVFNLVQEVNVLDSKDEANLALLARPELGITFTKLHCWRLTQYEKCVFIDADALVVRNCDELFEREELSAAPDVGWPDCFNSGVFVFKPSQQTFVSLTTFAASQGSFDGGDQGLLNSFFSDWAHKDISKHLPFIYNMCSTATYSYLPAFKQFGDGVKIIHFIGVAKPWLQYYDTMTGIVQPPPGTNHLQPLLQMWWNIFCDSVHPHLDPSMPLAMATRCRDSQSNFSCEATTTLAPNWHEFFSFSPNPNVCVSTPPYHNSHDNYCDDDVRKDPDFSEFKDPWDDYQDPVLEHFPCEVSESVHSEQYYTPINERLRESPLQAQDDFVENFHKENLSEEQMFGRSEQDHNFVPFQEDHHNQETESCHQHQHSQIAHPIQNPHHLEHEYHHKDSSISDTESHCDTQLVDDVTQTDDSDENFYHPHSSSSYSSVNMGTDEVDFHDEHPGTSKQHSPDPTKPCASPTSVAPQSQSHVRMSLEHEDTGLAGALSQLTLGQSRTPEQNAYEEQMRKQNWEQGYMDYMGRDSFDNIWKKICETLSKPMEEKTPPAKEKPLQEKAPSELSSDGAAAAAETEAPVLAEETPMEATAPVGVDPLQDIPRSCPRTFSMEVMPPSSIDEIEELFSPTLLDPEQLQSIELAMDALVESAILEMSSEIPEMLKDQPDPPGVGPSAEVPSESSSGTETLKSTDSAQPVPIQVAESVLQAEPKESVSEDPKPLSEEVVSSIVAPVQESAAAVSEGLIEPSNNVIPNNVPLAPNGIDSVDANLTSAPMTPPVTPPSSTAVVERSPNIVSVVHDFPPAALRREEQTGPEQMKEESDGLAKSKLTVVLPETQSTEETTSQPATSPAAEELSSPTSDLSKSDSVESPTALSPDGPTRPTRSKDIKIPGTPIVIEATPPTSPPLDVEVEPESPTKTESKTAKEVSKSSSLEDESSGSPESERSSKKVKKVVKKTKKSKEGEEADEGATSSDVSKKLPKSTRKSSKPDITPQGLEADSTVPETPPPEGNSDTPVPPKRKTKAPSPQPEP